MSDIPFQSTPKTDAEYQEVITLMFTEMEEINAQMRQTQAEIDRLRTEADAYRVESDRLRAERKRLDKEIRRRFDRLHTTLDRMSLYTVIEKEVRALGAGTFLLPDRDSAERFGQALGKLLRPGDVIALIGDLGTGKTTLTQAIARGLGIKVPVTSPTFALVWEYSGSVPLFHFDVYRLDNAEEMADLGFEEYFERDGVVIIEWADKILPLLPEERLTITLRMALSLELAPPFGSVVGRGQAPALQEAEEAGRRVKVEATGERYERVAEALEEAMADLRGEE